MKTKRHARAACIRTIIMKRNITTIMTTMANIIITTMMKRDTITTIMRKVV